MSFKANAWILRRAQDDALDLCNLWDTALAFGVDAGLL